MVNSASDKAGFPQYDQAYIFSSVTGEYLIIQMGITFSS